MSCADEPCGTIGDDLTTGAGGGGYCRTAMPNFTKNCNPAGMRPRCLQVGELFPGPSKTTRAYLHTEEAVRKALGDAGFTIKRAEMTSTNFYFSRMLEAVRE